MNGTTLDFGSGNAPATGLDLYVLHIIGTVESSVIPVDGTITSAKIKCSYKCKDALSGISATKLTTGILPLHKCRCHYSS